MKKKKLIIIRHFPTGCNHEGRIMGDSIDQDLAFDDCQREKLGVVSAYKYVYSSPTKRAALTAKIIFDAPILLDERIRPRGIGESSGKTLKEIKSICDEAVYEVDGKLYYNLLVTPPNSESTKDFLTRIRSFLVELLEKNVQDIAVVTHSMVGATIRAIAAGDSLHTATEKYGLDFYKKYFVSIDSKVIDRLDFIICEVE